MGHNFPKILAISLRNRYHIKAFIETGTYKGETAEWACQHFSRVYTIEGFEPRFVKTADRLKRKANLTMIQGDSRTALPKLLGKLSERCLFWLDAHWCGGNAAEAHLVGDECPLLDELEAINNHAWAGAHMILIDDARLFINPPPYPHDPKQWPSLDRLMVELQRMPRFIRVVNDVIIAVPTTGANLVEEFSHVSP